MNFLFITLTVVTSFLLIDADVVKLTVIGTDFPKYFIIAMAPFVIIFLISKYFYVSAISLNVYMAYIEYFARFHKTTLDEEKLHTDSLYNDFRIRNLSETINLFLISRQPRLKWKLSCHNIFKKITIIGRIIVTWSTLIIPIVFIFITSHWFLKNYPSKFDESFWIIFLIGYALFFVGLILFLFILTMETGGARKYYKKNIWNLK